MMVKTIIKEKNIVDKMSKTKLMKTYVKIKI